MLFIGQDTYILFTSTTIKTTTKSKNFIGLVKVHGLKMRLEFKHMDILINKEH